MLEISDQYMREMLSKTKNYTIVILKEGTKPDAPDKSSIIWEHGRRNFSLRAEKKLAIVCPVTSENGIDGICIFDAREDETRAIMDEDPAVKAGIFRYEMHNCKSFPGDSLG